ncbi:MAG: DUF814 domain-containing protein [candidate division Zixibacteria bacterium]|nr:DUF814 domain-containing protein [candidate division Zixibacteria bacterium]
MIQLTEAEEIEQLHYIIDEDCKELGIPIVSKHRRRQQSTKVGPHKFREYKIEDGIKIYIGRDGKDNDKLTFGFASKNDLWFHAQQSHGSHIILKRPQKNYDFSQNQINTAAAIAAYYSKARSSSSVPIIYTLVKYVRKPRGAPPGKALYSNEKSILVEPFKPKL